MTRQVLLIEDDDALRASLAQTLDLEGISVIPTAHFVQARRTIRANFAGVVLTDIRMPEKDGFDILALAQKVDPDLPVVMLTGEGDVPMAIRAMKEGAYDFLEKPCEAEHLLGVLNRALTHRELVLRTRRMERLMQRSDPASVNFPGETAASKTLRADLRAVAETGRHVMLLGDLGVGKRVAAHTIFTLSEGRDHFQIVRAPEIDPQQFRLESGAVDLSVRSVDQASEAQIACVLAAVQKRDDVRLIASAQRNVATLADLECVTVHVPSFAARISDIGVMFESVLRHAVRNRSLEMPIIPDEVIRSLEERDWSENLLELRAFANDFLENQTTENKTLAQKLDDYERGVLEETLRKHKGKATQVAEVLGLPRKTLYDRLARYGLRPRDYQ
ncbi:response regulator [Amylibacter sp. IMCC11727]|uniref:sigma-54-dependent transcriptional regulator n=1 Tax=Amylibacter sp. IMCC11727 TaxID=3039851 RepID=UPI00244E06C0|nr:response regulator [Amylibacter sp. IMCC11727]WGI21736.1 response regulator [Amylibacter sp. IMCC11727]